MMPIGFTLMGLTVFYIAVVSICDIDAPTLDGVAVWIGAIGGAIFITGLFL